MTNTELLKKSIEERGFVNKYIAAKMGVTVETFSRKVNGKSQFKDTEIRCIKEILDLTGEEVNAIFFA